MNKHKERLLDEVQKMIDFNKNIIKDSIMIDYFRNWFNQIESNQIEHPKLKRWIGVLIDYHRPKEPEYSNYLLALLDSNN